MSVPYMSFAHYKRTIGNAETSINLNFSLSGESLLRGIILAHTVTNRNLTLDATSTNVIVPDLGDYGKLTNFTTAQSNYALFVPIKQYYVQLN